MVASSKKQTSSAPSEITLADDAYHFRFYRGWPHLTWYTEWWYLAFSDPDSGWAGITALAIFNPENHLDLGRSGITTVLFPPVGAPVEQMNYLGVQDFTASIDRADVTVGQNTLRVEGDTYHLVTRDPEGQAGLDLRFRPVEKPQLMADEVVGYAEWEVASWLVYMPSALVEGTIDTGGQQIRLTQAAGYHDHNWGMWEVTKRTWAWAQFSAPQQKLSFVLGLHAAFWFTTGRFRLGELELQLPGELMRYEPQEWGHWKLFWRYPTRVQLTALDATGEYRLEMRWMVTATAALWKSPVPLFEQRARFDGRLLRRDKNAPADWSEVTAFSELGLAEYTATWL